MGKYMVHYEEWPQERLIELSSLLNNLMTTLDNTFANDDEEAGWLRNFETNLDELINKNARGG